VTQQNTFTLELKDLIVTPDRGRKNFPRMIEMADSIRKFGLIHPIVVAPAPDQPGKYILVAGERRYRGMVLAGCAEAQASLRKDSQEMLAEIELEENVCRADISYDEEGNILAKIMSRKKKVDPKWSVADTAEMTGRSVGDVSGKIKVHRKFKERPDLKEKCEGKPYTAAIRIIEQTEEAEKVQRLADQGQLQLTTELLLGNCAELIKNVATDSIDLLLTDPPYGVAKVEDLRTGGSDKLVGHQVMNETHNLTLEAVSELLTNLAPQLHRVMKDGAHFYMFCGFQYAGAFVSCLEPWLEFQPPMLIWNRGRPSSPGYGYNYLSCCEAIIYGHKPPRGRRLTEQMYCIIECQDVPKSLRAYPTEKPVPLLKTLIKQSTMSNGLVLDPFAGSGSTLIAAKELGRRAIGFEIDNTAYLCTQKRLTEGDDKS